MYTVSIINKQPQGPWETRRTGPKDALSDAGNSVLHPMFPGVQIVPNKPMQPKSRVIIVTSLVILKMSVAAVSAIEPVETNRTTEMVLTTEVAEATVTGMAEGIIVDPMIKEEIVQITMQGDQILSNVVQEIMVVRSSAQFVMHVGLQAIMRINAQAELHVEDHLILALIVVHQGVLNKLLQLKPIFLTLALLRVLSRTMFLKQLSVPPRNLIPNQINLPYFLSILLMLLIHLTLMNPVMQQALPTTQMLTHL